MTRLRLLVLTMAATLASATADAALTGASLSLDDNPRTAWLERYQDSRQGPEQTEKFTQTIKVSGDGALDLQNIAGDVRVSPGRGNEIQIDAVKRVRHRDAAEARRLLEQLRIEITQVGGRAEVRTVFPRVSGRQGLSAAVDYTITVPQNAAVGMKTISGDVVVNGVRGEVRAETVSGNVEVTSTPNLAVAKTISGNVTARDISAISTLTLGTVSGTVTATALKCRALEAGSVSGNLVLSNLQVERVLAKSVSGDIGFDATLARGGRYELTSHSGNVRIMLADKQGFELDASTFSGSVRTDFPVTLREFSPDSNRRGPSNRAIRGTYGDASAILALRSFSGNVVIVRK